MTPMTWDVVRYADGSGVVSAFDRAENGHLTYRGRVFYGADQMAAIVAALTAPPHDRWPEDDEQTAMRARRRRDALDAPDDVPF